MKLGSPVPGSDPGLRRGPTRAPGPTWALALLVVWGCQLVGNPGPPEPEAGRGPEEGRVQGVVYQGVLTLDGGEISAGLELIRTGGGRVRGALQTQDGLRADGSGRLRGRTLRLRLLYGGDCPGEIVLEGPWDQASGAYTGTAEAQDCTGSASGTFRFSSADGGLSRR